MVRKKHANTCQPQKNTHIGDTSRRSFLKKTLASATVLSGSFSVFADQVSAQESNNRVRWDTKISRRPLGGPTVADGTVYLESRGDYFYALDAADGTEEWRVELSFDGYYGKPKVEKETIYCSAFDVYALNTADGSEKWRFQPNNGITVQPAVADGLVFAGTSAMGDSDNQMYALDASDGSERWRFQTGDGYIRSPPTAANGTIFFGSGDGNLYAVDASDGTERWRFQTGSEISTTPAVVNGTVYFGSDNVYAVDVSDGTERWRVQISVPLSCGLAVMDGTVYVSGSDENLHALDGSDGTENWRFQDATNLITEPTVANGIVYVGSTGSRAYLGTSPNNLYAVDASNGTERWHFDAGNLISSSIIEVANSTVYFGKRNNVGLGGDNGTVYALETGESGDAPQNTLRIEGSGNYTYYAFRASGGVSSDGSLTSEDNIDGATASGAVGGGADTYTFEGELQNFYIDEGGRVFVNDQEVALSEYESVLSVKGDGSYTSYEFGVSGEITDTQGITGEDTVNTASASGAIAGGADTYTFTGTISGLSKDGGAAVVINGQAVDPSLFPAFSRGTNSLRIEGPGNYTYYAFRASGNVSSDRSLTSEDNIDGATASGAVGGGADTYTFEGELQNLYVGDGATVFVNGQEVALSNYESVLSVEGSGNYTSYQFGVSGQITETQGITGEDSVTNSSASGAIAGGADTYTFTGDINSFTRNGDAAIVLNGQEVDPALL